MICHIEYMIHFLNMYCVYTYIILCIRVHIYIYTHIINIQHVIVCVYVYDMGNYRTIIKGGLTRMRVTWTDLGWP